MSGVIQGSTQLKIWIVVNWLGKFGCCETLLVESYGAEDMKSIRLLLSFRCQRAKSGRCSRETMSEAVLKKTQLLIFKWFILS